VSDTGPMGLLFVKVFKTNEQSRIEDFFFPSFIITIRLMTFIIE